MNPEFAADLRNALAHLYDHTYLETHPLAEKIAAGRSGIARTRAQETRRILLDAIELLNPGDHVPLRAPERRTYEVLFGLYVEGRRPQDVADTLGVSERQLRRDRATAIDALAIIICDRYAFASSGDPTQNAETVPGKGPANEPPGASEADPAIEGDTLAQESRRLAHHSETVDLDDFFAKLLSLLSGLARQHQVELVAESTPTLPPLPLSSALLRQVVLSLASQSIHQLPLRRMAFLTDVTSERVGIGLGLTYRHGEEPSLEQAETVVTMDNAVETMVAALDGRIRWEIQGEHRHGLWVFLPRQQKMTVLVVDDKQDLFELFLRYLAGHPYQLRHAASVDEGLQLVEEAPPDMILLDLMMPERDGWEFLQALRKNATLSSIPVIVCSVLHEPELAFSLGAQHYLKKPVAADELLQAMERVRRQVWATETNPAGPEPSRSSLLR